MFTENFYEGVDFRDAEILENELNGITFTRCSFRGRISRGLSSKAASLTAAGLRGRGFPASTPGSAVYRLHVPVRRLFRRRLPRLQDAGDQLFGCQY